MPSDDSLDDIIRPHVLALVDSAPVPPTLRIGRPPRWRLKRMVMLALGVLIALALVAGLTWSFALRAPTSPVSASVTWRVQSPTAGILFGRVPRKAIVRGHVVWSLVPSYVPVVEAGSIVGYVMKVDVDGSIPAVGPMNGGTYSPVCGSDGINVYGPDLSTIVGAIYPNAGFVPTGQKPDCTETATTVS